MRNVSPMQPARDEFKLSVRWHEAVRLVGARRAVGIDAKQRTVESTCGPGIQQQYSHTAKVLSGQEPYRATMTYVTE